MQPWYVNSQYLTVIFYLLHTMQLIKTYFCIKCLHVRMHINTCVYYTMTQ